MGKIVKIVEMALTLLQALQLLGVVFAGWAWTGWLPCASAVQCSANSSSNNNNSKNNNNPAALVGCCDDSVGYLQMVSQTGATGDLAIYYKTREQMLTWRS